MGKTKANASTGRTKDTLDLAVVVIPDIADINSVEGLKRVAGNEKLYRSLLAQFAEKQGDAATQISEASRNGDRELAERIAHTVKGVAGNIGAAKIQVGAAGLESNS